MLPTTDLPERLSPQRTRIPSFLSTRFDNKDEVEQHRSGRVHVRTQKPANLRQEKPSHQNDEGERVLSFQLLLSVRIQFHQSGETELWIKPFKQTWKDRAFGEKTTDSDTIEFIQLLCERIQEDQPNSGLAALNHFCTDIRYSVANIINGKREITLGQSEYTHKTLSEIVSGLACTPETKKAKDKLYPLVLNIEARVRPEAERQQTDAIEDDLDDDAPDDSSLLSLHELLGWNRRTVSPALPWETPEPELEPSRKRAASNSSATNNRERQRQQNQDRIRTRTTTSGIQLVDLTADNSGIGNTILPASPESTVLSQIIKQEETVSARPTATMRTETATQSQKKRNLLAGNRKKGEAKQRNDVPTGQVQIESHNAVRTYDIEPEEVQEHGTREESRYPARSKRGQPPARYK
jgi:hypothetical protein